MAVLAIAAAGAWLAPAGYAALGWTIGMAVGNAFFAKTQTLTQEGPRLADLSVQTSTDGAPILQVHGAARIAGNIIWSAGIKETKSVASEDVGGKGGGQTVTTTSYSYSCSFALSLCEGPIAAVRKIWADGKIIYSAVATGDPEVIEVSIDLMKHMTLYSGNESQLPDPVIEAHEGIGNVPAYRGQAYLVFSDVPLVDFGNRIPNLTIEVVTVGAISRMRRIQTWARPSDSFTYEAGTVLSQTATYTSGETFTHRLRRYALDGELLEDRSVALPTLTPPDGFYGLVGATHFEFCKNNPRLLVVKLDGVGNTNASALYGERGQIARPIVPPLYTDTASSVYREMVNHGNYIYAGGVNAVMQTSWIARYPVKAEPSAFSAGALLSDAYVVISTTATSVSFGLATDEQGDVYVYLFGLSVIRRYDQSLNLIASWAVPSGSNDDDFSIVNGRAYLYYAIDNSLREYLLPAGGGTATLNHSIPATSGDLGPLILNDNLLFDGNGIVSLLDEVTPSNVPIATLVTALCDAAGLPSSSIEVSNLSGDVAGYVLTQPMSARAALEPLMRAHFFDAIESGKIIKFVPRGGASAVTIAEADLAAHAAGEAPPDPISIERDQELELPRAVTVLYMDPAADYQQGSQRSTRLITAGRAEVTVEMPMVLSADRARQIADVLLTDAWMARKRLPLALPPRYIDLEPTDVITVQGAAATHTVRLIDQEIGANGVIRAQAVAESASVYTSTATGAPPAIPAPALALVGPTNLHMLDVPLLRDLDDTPGGYLAAAGYLGGWKGALIEQSRDGGESWSALVTKLTATPMGFATNTLPAAADTRLWDHAGSVNVRLPSGTLSASTEDGVIAGANLALLGVHGRWELLHFRDAVLEADGTWTLRSFLRGCFGSEYAVDKHAVNDVFILVTATSLLHVTQTLADIGLALKYHALSIGAPAYTPATVDFTNTGLRLRPYPVNNLAGIKQANGDWLIQWTPRVRKGQSWMSIASIAADPVISGYQIDIMSGSTVKRSVYVTGATTFTYPAGGQQQDFAAVQSTLKVRVYAYNAQVGLGYGVEITAPTNAESYLAPVAFTGVAYGSPGTYYGETRPQITTLTLGGTFAAGTVYKITLGTVPFSYTALAGDTDLTGVATAIAALINPHASYAASAAAAVVTVTGPVSTPYAVAASATTPGMTIALTQAAGAARDAIRKRLQYYVEFTPAMTSQSYEGALNDFKFELRVVNGIWDGVTQPRVGVSYPSDAPVVSTYEYTLTTNPFSNTNDIVNGLVNAWRASGDGAGKDIWLAPATEPGRGIANIEVGLPLNVTGWDVWPVTTRLDTGGPSTNLFYMYPPLILHPGQLAESAKAQKVGAVITGAPVTNTLYRITLGGTNYDYTATAGDTSNASIATQLAAVIQAGGTYAASAAGEVITITGAVSTSYTYTRTVTPPAGTPTISFAVTQNAI